MKRVVKPSQINVDISLYTNTIQRVRDVYQKSAKKKEAKLDEVSARKIEDMKVRFASRFKPKAI